MASKRKKYDTRFPAGRIKKIMRTDDEVGKVAHAVPVVLSRAVQLFLETLLRKTANITENREARTITVSHLKQCIMNETEFDFLMPLVKNVQNNNKEVTPSPK